MTMIQTIILNGLLRLARIDELHQFVVFGWTVRPEFSLLKDSLFKIITMDNEINTASTNSTLSANLKVPLLSMTAIFNVE